IDTFTLTDVKGWDPESSGRVLFAGKIQGAPINIEGDIAPFLAEPQADLQVKLEGLELGEVVPPAVLGVKALDGKLTAEVGLKVRRGSSGGLSVEQVGSIQVGKWKLSHATAGLEGRSIGWDGELQVSVDSAAGAVRAVGNGRLSHGLGRVEQRQPKVSVDHQGLTWEGRFELTHENGGLAFVHDGTLRQPGMVVRLVDSATRFVQDELAWQGGLGVKAKGGALEVVANGGIKVGEVLLSGEGSTPFQSTLEGVDSSNLGLKMTSGPSRGTTLHYKGSASLGSIETQVEDLTARHDQIGWQGEVDFQVGSTIESPPVLTVQGELKGGPLSLVLGDERLQVAYTGVEWGGDASITGWDLAHGLSLRGGLDLEELVLGTGQRGASLLRAGHVYVSGMEMEGLDRDSVAEVAFHDLYLSGTRREFGERSGMLQSLVSRFTDIKYGHPDRLSIEGIEHRDLRMVVQHEPDGGWNTLVFMDAVQDIFQLTDAANDADEGVEVAEPVAEPTGEAMVRLLPAEAVPETGFGLRVGRAWVVGESSIQLEDRGVEPPFQTTLNLDEFEITNFDT
ncbi:MAG: DUF748 domain-containing protein, partial [Gammaproteobacteria bacterium]|nr:DUF748 domain-containing protein [Gammaproteobacteria bacterium]